MAVCAGYGIKVCIAAQDVNQLNKEYTKDNSIASNCHVHIFLRRIWIRERQRRNPFPKISERKQFRLYLKLLFDGGISEYEDDSEYAPSGCVSFLTIHQSKGMEFPIVFVDSLANLPRKQSNKILEPIEDKYFQRPTFNPRDQTKFFDFW